MASDRRMPEAFLDEHTISMAMFALNAVSPWLSMVDPIRFSAEVARVGGLEITTIASGHSPTITGEHVPMAWDALSSLAGLEAPPMPDQAVLDLIVAATTQVPAAN